jgi:hypothetical protein
MLHEDSKCIHLSFPPSRARDRHAERAARVLSQVGYAKHWGKLRRLELSFARLSSLEAARWLQPVTTCHGYVPMSSAGVTLPNYNVDGGGGGGGGGRMRFFTGRARSIGATSAYSSVVSRLGLTQSRQNISSISGASVSLLTPTQRQTRRLCSIETVIWQLLVQSNGQRRRHHTP